MLMVEIGRSQLKHTSHQLVFLKKKKKINLFKLN